MYKLKCHIVDSLQDSFRIETYCRGIFEELPSNKSVKKAVSKGIIRVGGAVVSSAYFVQLGDEIELWELEGKGPSEYDMEIEVVYEDDDLAVVFKPAGLTTSGNQFRTLENAIQGKLKPCENNPLKWPKPVHRLDNPTSGLVIVAKSIAARVELGRMLERKEIQKTYCALLSGKYDKARLIDKPLEGKESKTEVEVVAVKESLNNGFISLVKLKPITGRTHQLRKHTSGEGFPIVGDKEYGEQGNTLLHKGLFLCAFKLELVHPVSGKPLVVEAKIPSKFRKLMEREFERFKKYNE